MEITVDDVANVLPRALTEGERERAEALIEQAVALISLEFARRGRSLVGELESVEWLPAAVLQAVRVMVSQAVLVGEDVGRASVSSTTGPQSDSITYSQGVKLQWGGVGMTDDILDLLGLGASAVPRGRGGVVIPFGERRRFRGAEFSERRWCP